MGNRKRITAFLWIFSAFILSACGTKAPVAAPSPYVVSPDGIVSLRFFEETDAGSREIEVTDEKSMTDILNTAVYDDDFNDGRQVKIIANSFRMQLQYRGGSETTVLLWDDRIRVDGTWYLLNINRIKEIIY